MAGTTQSIRRPFIGGSFPLLRQSPGGQGEAAAYEVDLDDPYGDLVAFAHDLAGVLDGLVTELGVVHEALDAIGDTDEGPERDQLGHLARGDKACLVREGKERVLLESFQRQLNLSALGVHVDDLADDSLAGRDGVGGMVDPPPAQFGAPDESGALVGRFAVEVRFWHRSWGDVAESYADVRLRGNGSGETAYALPSDSRK